MAAAQAATRRVVEAIERQARERTEAGLALDGLPDLSADGERDSFYQAQLIRELAVRHVTSWTGVELNEGSPSLGCRHRARSIMTDQTTRPVQSPCALISGRIPHVT